MYLDVDLNLVHIDMQNYQFIREGSEADWLNPLMQQMYVVLIFKFIYQKHQYILKTLNKIKNSSFVVHILSFI